MWEIAVPLAVACDFFGGELLCAVLFPHEMSWMRSGTESNHFLGIFLTYSDTYHVIITAFDTVLFFLFFYENCFSQV